MILFAMIKKYNQYIKETIDRSDIDPYGEENWETNELTPVLQEANKKIGYRKKY